MVCDICNSVSHDSENCDKHFVKNAAGKKKKIRKPKRYSCCKGKPIDDHLPDKKCKIFENCIGCFSTEHHALFCADRLKALTPFVPKIDQVLWPRFFETFEIDEKYSLISSSPFASTFLTPIKIKNSLDIDKKIPSTEDTIFIHGSLRLNNSDPDKLKLIFDSVASKTLICLPQTLILMKPTIPAEMILQLLSPYTKTLSMAGSTCDPNISLSDIIKKAPNLQEIDTYSFETNIVFEKTWMEDLLKYKNGKNFKSLHVKLDSLELDVENLAEFVKTKCAKDINIQLTFNEDLEDDLGKCWEPIGKINDKLYQYFDHPKSDEEHDFLMGFPACDSDGMTFLSLKNVKTPKQRIMPKRDATKRKYVNKR